MLTSVLRAAEGAAPGAPVYLHVQTSNEDAIAFYKSFGFAITDTVLGVYRRLSPPDAYRMTLMPAAAAAACAPPLPFVSGRISSDITDLEALHETWPWIPGAADVRPPPATLDRKRARLAHIQDEWASFTDYIRVTVFGLPRAVGSSGLHVSVGGDDVIPPLARVFAPNEFPYNVPRHYVLWYGPDVTSPPSDNMITEHIREAMASAPELAGLDFGWYVNPKMTVPEYFHVQVFMPGKA